MTYNPLALVYTLAVKMYKIDPEACPIIFWSFLRTVGLGFMCIPMFMLLFIYFKYFENRDRGNLLFELGEMDEYKQIETIWRLCLEANIPYLLDLREYRHIVFEKQEC